MPFETNLDFQQRIGNIFSEVKSKKPAASALCQLLFNIGFKERIKGNHYIFSKDNVDEILNLQPLKGKVKQYQLKQARNVFLKYNIGDKL